jgi:hypothetical protein
VRRTIDPVRGSHRRRVCALGQLGPGARIEIAIQEVTRRFGSRLRTGFAEDLAVEGERDSGPGVVGDAAVLPREPEGHVVARGRELERLPRAPQHRARRSARKVGRAVAAQDADKPRHQRRVQLW